ncbi:MAG: type II toxin-antitoxin system prevent-host-death family antitoxin [candidate division KSB1 bacterium]|nr:type II toxin-antitoxin system prevent-host-death family antitoxin [candidate division KSB1 bacterium]MDQ7063062.1 type II toxin-antitoxin system prevent-host-death family antitoxin [candidate division KSB1 bacterium]
MIATARDLRFHTKEILEAVLRGEEVIITYRGKPRARILPIEPIRAGDNLGEEPDDLFGMWKDYDETADVENYVRSIRRGRR